MLKFKIDHFQNIPLPEKMVSWLDITMGGDQFRDAIIGIKLLSQVIKLMLH